MDLFDLLTNKCPDKRKSHLTHHAVIKVFQLKPQVVNHRRGISTLMKSKLASPFSFMTSLLELSSQQKDVCSLHKARFCVIVNSLIALFKHAAITRLNLLGRPYHIIYRFALDHGLISLACHIKHF